MCSGASLLFSQHLILPVLPVSAAKLPACFSLPLSLSTKVCSSPTLTRIIDNIPFSSAREIPFHESQQLYCEIRGRPASNPHSTRGLAGALLQRMHAPIFFSTPPERSIIVDSSTLPHLSPARGGRAFFSHWPIARLSYCRAVHARL